MHVSEMAKYYCVIRQRRMDCYGRIIFVHQQTNRLLLFTKTQFGIVLIRVNRFTVISYDGNHSIWVKFVQKHPAIVNMLQSSAKFETHVFIVNFRITLQPTTYTFSHIQSYESASNHLSRYLLYFFSSITCFEYMCLRKVTKKKRNSRFRCAASLSGLFVSICSA